MVHSDFLRLPEELNMRIMGLDFGSKTVGVAVCDPLGITAQTVETITFGRQGLPGRPGGDSGAVYAGLSEKAPG